MKTILITGASSGIGEATARHFQAKGWNVIATMRDPSEDSALAGLENVLVTRLDVTDCSVDPGGSCGGHRPFRQDRRAAQ